MGTGSQLGRLCGKMMHFYDLKWLVSGTALDRDHMEGIDGSQRVQEALRILLWMGMQKLPRIVQGARSLAMIVTEAWSRGKQSGTHQNDRRGDCERRDTSSRKRTLEEALPPSFTLNAVGRELTAVQLLSRNPAPPETLASRTTETATS